MAFRAIPERNPHCAMKDRDRSYKLHQEALRKIQNGHGYTGAQSQLQNSAYRPRSLHGKVQIEEQKRITHENQKIMKAIATREPILSRANMYIDQLDHEHQVKRMANKNHEYGFDQLSKSKNTTSQNSSLPQLIKSSASKITSD